MTKDQRTLMLEGYSCDWPQYADMGDPGDEDEGEIWPSGTPDSVRDLFALGADCDALEARVDDAYRMGEQLRTVIARMRAENENPKQVFVYPHDAEIIDDLAQIGTVLLGVKS